jgi:hypothetical protein
MSGEDTRATLLLLALLLAIFEIKPVNEVCDISGHELNFWSPGNQ